MIKFLTTAGLIFDISLLSLIGIYLVFFLGVKAGEFMDYVDREYGLRGASLVFLVALAIISLVVAAVITFKGV